MSRHSDLLHSIHMYDEFERKRTAPLWWYNKSSDLHASAGALWIARKKTESDRLVDELELGKGFNMSVACWPVYQMLWGLSLELVFKAVSVARGEDPQHTHDLMKLARRACVAIAPSEEKVLTYLTDSIVWAGRYPVPKDRESFGAHLKNSDDALMEKVEDSSSTLTIKRYNRALDWENVNPIWSQGQKAFFDVFDSE